MDPGGRPDDLLVSDACPHSPPGVEAVIHEREHAALVAHLGLDIVLLVRVEQRYGLLCQVLPGPLALLVCTETISHGDQILCHSSLTFEQQNHSTWTTITVHYKCS